MDLQKYEEALDNISETIVPTYFKGDNSKYDKAKTKMMVKFELIQNEDMFDSLPFFIPYFRRNFLFFCQNKQNFVGTILRSVANITFSNVKNYLVSTTRLFYITDPDEKLIIAENSYQVIHNEILKIIDSPKILKRNIHEVLNQVRSLSTVIYNIDIRVIYTLLLNELSYSLQILYNIDDLDKMVPPDRIVINEYSGILNELSKLNKRDYSRYPIVQIFIKDLEIIYNRIEEFHSKPQQQDKVSDSGTITSNPTNVDKAVGLLGHIEGLTWDKITIVLTSLDTIRLTTGYDYKKEHHYSTLGMDDKRKKGQSDGTWRLLSLFAIKNGTVTYSEIENTGNYASPKKAVSTLQKKLKQLIGLTDNPIENYESKVGYKAKLYFKSEIPSQFHGSVQQIEKINELKGE